jgi:hypothetical protein
MRPTSLLLFCACTLATRPELLRFEIGPGATASGWRKYEAPAFTLVTDLSDGDARDAAQKIASELVAIEAAFGHLPPPYPSRLEVIVYANGLDYEARFDRHSRMNVRLDAEHGRQRVYLWGRPANWAPQHMVGQYAGGAAILRQALARAVLDRQVPQARTPPWLAHGLALYFETLAWSDDGKSVEVGALNAPRLEQYHSHRAIGFDDVIAAPRPHPGQEQAFLSGFQGYSWALMHMLILERPQALEAYLAELKVGAAPDPHQLFGGATGDEIDRRVHQHVLALSFSLRQVPVTVPAGVAKVSAVTAEELASWSPREVPKAWQ